MNLRGKSIYHPLHNKILPDSMHDLSLHTKRYCWLPLPISLLCQAMHGHCHDLQELLDAKLPWKWGCTSRSCCIDDKPYDEPHDEPRGTLRHPVSALNALICLIDTHHFHLLPLPPTATRLTHHGPPLQQFLQSPIASSGCPRV